MPTQDWQEAFFQKEKEAIWGVFREIASGGGDLARGKDSRTRKKIVELDRRYDEARLAAGAP